jgi:hypothetical protein
VALSLSLRYRVHKLLLKARDQAVETEQRSFKKRQLYANLYGASLRRLHQMAREHYGATKT